MIASAAAAEVGVKASETAEAAPKKSDPDWRERFSARPQKS